MDLPSMENYPVYVINVVPELTEEASIEVPIQLASSQTPSFNFYVPSIEQHNPELNILDTQISNIQNNKYKEIRPLTKIKRKHGLSANNSKSVLLSKNKVISKKMVCDYASLLSDEDISNKNKKVEKYDASTNTNVIFHLLSPSDLLTENIKPMTPKRGRPRKDDHDLNENKSKPEEAMQPEKEVIECSLTTKCGRLSKPPKHLLNGKIVKEPPKKLHPIVDNDDILGRKKVKYNVKSDFVCGGCHKTYLGHKRMQEHLEKFPSHKVNTNDQHSIESEFQDIFEEFNKHPINDNNINGKKESHTQTETFKNHKCGFMKSKKNLTGHLKQIMKHIKKTNILKSLTGTISPWDLLASNLDNGNLQMFSKELNTIIINLRNLSKMLTQIPDCELNAPDNTKMFVDDTLGQLMSLPKGTYSLHNFPNNVYEIPRQNDVWTENPGQAISLKVPISQTPIHSSPIHLNMFDSQTSKVDFLLSSSMEESMMCDENQAALESVDGLVSERLRTMTDHLETSVPLIGYPSSTSTVSVSQPHVFMSHGVYEVFSNDMTLVPTSTEEFIKSLEQFEPLHDAANTLNTETRMLDFEDLQHPFHTSQEL
ncbi:uncharacterized protein LOC126834604 [Adelges cooleyi]|uniref:uncharacterized protein LOC126834604 n=1 Tax=Adelges cooleyi TaxID=133065 RepID=UPI0021804431|nr:uncharacterized protein LOC126834604 [Adelges cooleyi]XP_050422614.1 uncharacterized protein LOC126834604 [Adelges cooleyi]